MILFSEAVLHAFATASSGTAALDKFTSVHDHQPIERVEIATLKLAEACGIRIPETRLTLQDTPYPIALLRRFGSCGAAPV